MEINLGGQWRFREDPERAGIRGKWYNAAETFDKDITLPGTMEEAGYGNMVRKPSTNDLCHTFEYKGQAWYSREVEYTAKDGEKVFLFLERVQWESWVYVNGHFIGMRNTLVGPHIYDITDYVTAPSFTLTIMQDNSNRVSSDSEAPTKTEDGTDIYGRALGLHLHTAADNTQKIGCGLHMISYSYNGVVGSIKLIIKPCVNLSSVHAYPDTDTNTVDFRTVISNESGFDGSAVLSCECIAPDGKKFTAKCSVSLDGEDGQKVNLVCHLGEEKHLWDEFSPEMYDFTLKLEGDFGTDERTDRFGMRKLEAKGRHILINGRRMFMRATLEGCAFPYTGYTPMDEDFWARAFTILKRYGLNGMRMHSFVPPEAAFRAADRLGFYIQAELPGTSCPSSDEDPVITEYLTGELKNLLEYYGDHPSFMFCSMGNEQLVSGDREFIARHTAMLNEKVSLAKNTDPRHMYTGTSHPYNAGRENDDFYLVATKDEIVMNGIRWGGPEPIHTSRFCLDKPSTAVNFEEGVLRMDKPVLTHEVGQWAVYPNLKEMHKYTGILKPRNFEIFAKQLDEAGLLGQIDDFVNASGKLSVLLYKEEIESALRTADLSGFELLDIHDYPGQGTSTVGLLDVFFDSKGLITEEEFSGFCSAVVPLAEMEKLVWTSGEKLKAVMSVADYSGKDIENTEMHVTLTCGAVKFEKTLPCNISDGGLTTVGECEFDLDGVSVPCRCHLTAEIDGHTNFWNVWVYPEASETEVGDVFVTDSIADAAEQLESGKKVFYIRRMSSRPKHAVHGSFTSQFWNPFMKPQETRNGILTNPSAPIFDNFPTDFHTDWNWHDIIMNSWVLEMDDFPKDFFPTVQVVPGIKDNNKLGLIWECRTGNGGKLLVCMADINDVTSRPAAAQLKRSILDYMNSASFAPKDTLDISLIADSLE